MNVNTSTYQGTSPISWDLNQNVSLKNKDEITNYESDLSTESLYISTQSYASEFGFRVDERGFFDKELNKMAKIPLDYEISLKSAYAISKELIKQDPSLSLSNIDLTGTINKYYNALSSVNESFTKGNENLSRAEISSLVAGFSTQSGAFEGQIVRTYENLSALAKAQAQNKELNPLKLDNKIIDFKFQSATTNTGDNELLKPYLTQNGEVSKAGLLMNFIHKDLKDGNEKVEFFIEPVKLDLSAHQNLYTMLNAGEQAFEDYVREENKEKMSFDLYLHVNGINKQTTDEDKLATLYQQYINYQKDVNIKEFANSSSIYELYVRDLSAKFREMAGDFKAQSADTEYLESLNERRTSADASYIGHKQRMAQLDKIFKSYASVMG